jgi:hypothetical protein
MRSIQFIDAEMKILQEKNSNLLGSVVGLELLESAFLSFGGNLELGSRTSFLQKWSKSDYCPASSSGIQSRIKSLNSEFFSSTLMNQNRRLVEHIGEGILFYDPHGIAEMLIKSCQFKSKFQVLEFVEAKSFDTYVEKKDCKTLLKFFDFNLVTSRDFSYSGVYGKVEFISTSKKSSSIMRLCKLHNLKFLNLDLDYEVLCLLFLDILLEAMHPEFIQKRNQTSMSSLLINEL